MARVDKEKISCQTSLPEILRVQKFLKVSVDMLVGWRFFLQFVIRIKKFQSVHTIWKQSNLSSSRSCEKPLWNRRCCIRHENTCFIFRASCRKYRL